MPGFGARFARNGDFWSGLALALLGAYIVVQARGWTYMGEDGPGAGFFPLWYGGVMVLLSLSLVVCAALRRPAEGSPAVRWNDVGRALACWAAFVACVVLMKLAGFVVAYAALTWFIVAVMARQPQGRAVALAIGGAVAFYLLFQVALDVSLPKGLLF